MHKHNNVEAEWQYIHCNKSPLVGLFGGGLSSVVFVLVSRSHGVLSTVEYGVGSEILIMLNISEPGLGHKSVYTNTMVQSGG